MKVAIGFHIQKGPWGGANLFAKSLKSYLEQNGCQVYSTLEQHDLDIILLTEPRRNLGSGSFNDRDISKYLQEKNPNALVVQRVNDCDERRNNFYLNPRIEWSNQVADHTVYIGSWLQPLFEKQCSMSPRWSVVRNGGDPAVFNTKGGLVKKENDKIRLVTHHWGDSWLKGWDIYISLDELLAEPDWSSRFSFAYIGKPYQNYQFKNSEYHGPCSGLELASLLKQNHVYFSASQYEPAGMHHIEGALCGLPLIYRDSGALPEYCHPFGVEFCDFESFKGALIEMERDYTIHKESLTKYPYTAEKMCREFYELFQSLMNDRNQILEERKLRINPYQEIGNKLQEQSSHEFLKQIECKDVPGFSLQGLVRGKIHFDLSIEAMLQSSYGDKDLLRVETQTIDAHFSQFKNKCTSSITERFTSIWKSSGKREKVQFWNWLYRLLELDECQKHILKESYLIASVSGNATEVYKSTALIPETAGSFKSRMKSLDWWAQPAESAYLILVIMDAIQALSPNIYKECSDYVIQFYYSIQKHKNGGFYIRNKPDFKEFCSTAYSVIRLHQAIGRPLPKLELIVDSVLEDTHETNGMDFLDALDILCYALENGDYRKRDISDYILFCASLLDRHKKQDGGFSYFYNCSIIEYRGQKVCEGLDESDLVATMLARSAIFNLKKLQLL